MEQPQSPENQDKTEQPKEPSTPIITNDIKEIPQEEESKNKANETSYVEHKPIEVIVKQENEKHAQPIIANIIAAFGVIVSAVLFYYTYLLFSETQKSTKAAERSATAAENAVSEQIENDRIARIDDAIKDSTDSINNAKMFSIYSKSLEAQVNAMKQTQKDFELENRAFVQIADIGFDTLQEGKNIQIRFIVKNFGRLPAKVILAKYKLIFMPITAQDTVEKMGTFVYADNNNILAGDFKIEHRISTGFAITKDMLNEINSGSASGYLIGTIDYLNMSDNRKYRNIFYYKISTYPRIDIAIIKNFEIPI